jgi:hypothetical protein
MAKKTKIMPPIHPGETLREDFLKPLGLTANRLAMELLVPVTRITVSRAAGLRYTSPFQHRALPWFGICDNMVLTSYGLKTIIVGRELGC